MAVLFPLHGQEERRRGHGYDLRRNRRDPNAVDAPEQREDQNRGDLKHQRPQEGYGRGDEPVVHRRKKG